MVKIGLIPLLLMTVPFGLSNAKPADTDSYHDSFTSNLVMTDNERGNKTLTGLDNKNKNVRIYAESEVDEISAIAFSGATFTDVMISNNVTHITDAVFNNAPSITTISYTGSKEEFASLNLSFDINHVSEYSYDEGFINYWNKEIRPEDTSNICNITDQTFSKVYSLYKALEINDKNFVDNYEDKGKAKIKDSMKELIDVFGQTSPSQKNDEWNQTGAITFIIIIALIGMTSITVFFLLKTKKIID